MIHENTESLGRRIARLRLEHGMTQERLANLANVSAQAVSKWENDQSYPDITLLPLLAQTFGVTVDELLGAKTVTREPEPELAPVPAPASEPEPETGPVAAGKATHVRIHITEDGRDAVNIAVPLMAANTLASIAGIVPGIASNIDLKGLAGIAQDAEPGTLVDIDDDKDRITITLE